MDGIDIFCARIDALKVNVFWVKHGSIVIFKVSIMLVSGGQVFASSMEMLDSSDVIFLPPIHTHIYATIKYACRRIC